MNHNPFIFLWNRFPPPLPVAAILIASVRAQSFGIQLSWCGGNLLWVKGMEVRRGWELDEVRDHKSVVQQDSECPFCPKSHLLLMPGQEYKKREYYLQIPALNNLSQGHFGARGVSSLHSINLSGLSFCVLVQPSLEPSWSGNHSSLG